MMRAPADTQIVSTRWGPMLVFHADEYIGRSLDLYGEYCVAEFDILSQLVRPGSTVVEVGANIGPHTVALARRCAPGRLYAFEPQQRPFQLLCANLALGQVANAVCRPDACGAATAHATFQEIDYAATNNSGAVSLGPDQGAGGGRVRVVRLDDLGLPGCDLLKIDVEGWESAVLEGASDTIARFAPSIYLENDRAAQQQRLISTLDSFGYQSFWHVAPLFNPDNFNRVAENVFGGSVSLNMLSVPKSRASRVSGLTPVDPANWWSPVPPI